MSLKRVSFFFIFIFLIFCRGVEADEILFKDGSLLTNIKILSASDTHVRVWIPWIPEERKRQVAIDFDIIDPNGTTYSESKISHPLPIPLLSYKKEAMIAAYCSNSSEGGLLGYGQQVLCMLQSLYVPPWACSCGAWRSDFSQKNACQKGEIDPNDMDCDGISNERDPEPSIPYSTQWTKIESHGGGYYLVRYDPKLKKYIVKVETFFEFPESYKGWSARDYVRRLEERCEKVYSTPEIQFEFDFYSNKDRRSLEDIEQSKKNSFYTVSVTLDQGRSHLLHWYLMDQRFWDRPFGGVQHEVGHMLGLNDAYEEEDWLIKIQKKIFGNTPDPEDKVSDSIMVHTGGSIIEHHYFKILGGGSCPKN